MKIVDRYIGRQVLFTTQFAISVLSLVLVLGNIFKQLLPRIVNGEVSIEVLLKFIAFILPFSLIFTIPWGLLMAILLVFGRLSADNELISLRMAGLSMVRICLPVLVTAVFLSFLCFYINIEVAPRAQAALKTMFYRTALENPEEMFGKGKIVDKIPGYVIYVGDREETTLKDFHLFQVSKKKVAMQYVRAEETEIEADRENEQIVLNLKGAHQEKKDSVDPLNTDKMVHGIRFGELPIVISISELAKRRLRPEDKTLSEINYLLKNDLVPPEKIPSFRSEITQRVSFSFACITFCLIGIPLGITAQRKETTIGFVISLVVAFVYFLFIIFGDIFSSRDDLVPHIFYIAPNVIFISLGVFLFWRLSKR